MKRNTIAAIIAIIALLAVIVGIWALSSNIAKNEGQTYIQQESNKRQELM